MGIEAAEVKFFLRSVKGTSKTDRLRNDIRTEPGIFSLNGNIGEMEAKSS